MILRAELGRGPLRGEVCPKTGPRITRRFNSSFDLDPIPMPVGIPDYDVIDITWRLGALRPRVRVEEASRGSAGRQGSVPQPYSGSKCPLVLSDHRVQTNLQYSLSVRVNLSVNAQAGQ